MWFFKKQTSLVGSGILEGFTDYHSHILPGVDDGIQTLGESLDTLDCLEKLGVKSIWLTPHVMEDIPNSPFPCKCILRPRKTCCRLARLKNIC